MARQAALRDTLESIDRWGVRKVVFEECAGEAPRDRASIGRWQRDRNAPLVYLHVAPKTEPLLWVSDYVAWTHGRPGRYWRRRIAPVLVEP